jgi:hypothetical protein
MTSSSARLVAAVRELIATGIQADERVDTLVLRGPLPSPDAQAEWLAFVDDIPPPFTTLQVYHPAVGGDLVPGDTFDPDRAVVVNLGKPTADGRTLFFFQTAIAPVAITSKKSAPENVDPSVKVIAPHTPPRSPFPDAPPTRRPRSHRAAARGPPRLQPVRERHAPAESRARFPQAPLSCRPRHSGRR